VRILIRLVINAIALWAAASLLSGITLSDNLVTVLIVAAIFGIINALVRPIVTFLTFPITLVTLGLFILVINAAMLQLTDALTSGLQVTGFWTSVAGGFIISVVSWVLSVFLPDDDDDRRRQPER
jgi:putative membrane protein